MARYDWISPVYDLVDWPFERFRYRPLRPLLTRGMTGRILDAGVGSGRNLPFYAPEACVHGIDASAGMLARARRRAEGVACRVAELTPMDVTKLSYPDGTFDGVVTSFLFCVLSHHLQVPALSELVRVTRPGGHIRLLEYQYSRRPLRRLMMRLMAPGVQAVFGARFDRPTHAAIETLKVPVVEERWVHGDVIKMYELAPHARDGGEKG